MTIINMHGVWVRPEKVGALRIHTGGYNGNGGYNQYLYAYIDGAEVLVAHDSSNYRYMEMALEDCLKILNAEEV